MNAPRHREHEYPEEHPNRPKYFPDITLGNWLTMLTILLAAMGSYAANESRVTKIETTVAQQEKAVDQQKTDTAAMILELKEANKALDAKIEKVDDKLDQILLRLNTTRSASR